MLRPCKVRRVAIVASKDRLSPIIEALYELGAIHINDYRGTEEGFCTGKPLEGASELSEKLLFLRSASKLLGLGEESIEFMDVENVLDERFSEVEREIRGMEDEKSKVEDEIKELEREKMELQFFSNFPVPLELYGGYESLSVFVGRVRERIADALREITDEFELFEADDGRSIALFVRKEMEGEILSILSRYGFSALKVPEGRGHPSERIAEIESMIEERKEKLRDLQRRLDELRTKHASFIISAEKYLREKVEKAEAPLRFAVAQNSFMIDGWVLEERYEEMVKKLMDATGGCVYIETLEEGVAHEEIPVELRNPRISRSFEMLVNAFGRPLYHELDPTSIIFLTFSAFFGFMIGDVGYGAVLALLGWYLKRPKNFILRFTGIGGRDFGNVILWGSAFSILFGAFVFGEAFGIHFFPREEIHEWIGPFALHGELRELYWCSLFGVKDLHLSYTIGGIRFPISKVGPEDIPLLLISTPLIGIAHMSLGLAFGFRNEMEMHGTRRAISKIGWLGCFISFMIVLIMVSQLGLSSLMKALNMISSGAFPSLSYPGIMFYVLLLMLFLSIMLIVIGEGFLSIMELPMVLANSLSYIRLTAVGASKAYLSYVFNMMGFEMMIFSNGVLASPASVAQGILILILGHMMVPVLGLISSSLHSLRLQYYEFFIKFYTGGGPQFIPFGRRHGA